MAKLGDLISTCNGRLTLTSGSPVTTSDVTAATTLYFTPYKGNNIALYNTTHEEWVFYNFTERSISLSGKTADTNYDVFIYDSSGTLTLELVAWTDATNRATALATQDGAYVKTGELNKRYLGTIRTTSTIGQCEDSLTKRFVWNYYNRTLRRMYKTNNVGHSYTTASWRAYNNDTTEIFEFVCGVAEITLDCTIESDNGVTSGTAYTGMAFGYDSTSSTDGDLSAGVANWYGYQDQFLAAVPAYKYAGIGYHYISIVEYGGANGYFRNYRAAVKLYG